MSLTPQVDLGPYPAACTDASWKAAKLAGNRDKWHTELGAALRAAQVAYNKVKVDQLDINLHFQAHNVRFDILRDIDNAKTAAKHHYAVMVKPAIKALDTAISRATTAGRNPIISAPARTKAKQIATALKPRLAQLKSFKTTDYDRKHADVLRNQQFAFDGFNRKVASALRDADTFVRNVRATPTPAEFNTHIGAAARGITQCIGQVERMKKNGLDVGKDERRATALFNQLDPWANDQEHVAGNAGPGQVMTKLRAFNTMVTAVKVWWG